MAKSDLHQNGVIQARDVSENPIKFKPSAVEPNIVYGKKHENASTWPKEETRLGNEKHRYKGHIAKTVLHGNPFSMFYSRLVEPFEDPLLYLSWFPVNIPSQYPCPALNSCRPKR